MYENWPIAAIALIIGVDKVLSTLRDRGIDVRKIAKEIEELHKWHDREDEDGVKVWYIRKTLETAIETLADNISMQTKLLEKMHSEDTLNQKRLEFLENQMLRIARGGKE